MDILIEIDNLYRIVLWDQRELPDGVRAIETIFGYVLHGCHGEDINGPLPCQCFEGRQVECMQDMDSVGTRDTELTDSQSHTRPISSERVKRSEVPLIGGPDKRPLANRSTWMRTCRTSERLSPERSHHEDHEHGGQIQETWNDSVVKRCEPDHHSTGSPEAPVHGCDELPPEASVPGLTWETQTHLSAAAGLVSSCPITEPELLSAVTKPFDPGGEVLFQCAWRDAPSSRWDGPR